MSTKIIKVYKEKFPALRFIGKQYTSKEDFGEKWGEWHQNGWFDIIEKLGASSENDNSYLGAKRISNGELVYWIGMLFPEATETPKGFEYVDIDPVDIAVFWVYGKDAGELTSFETHNKCLSKMPEYQYVRKEDDWCFERYNCPRFTSPDEKGNIIVDYCISIERTE